MVFRLRSRSFGARKQRRGVTFKRRAASVGTAFRKGTRRFTKSSKKFVKPKAVAKKAFKMAKFKNKNTSRLLTLAKGVADQVFLFSYVDQFTVAGTTGQKAVQGMWVQQNASTGTLGATNIPLVNMQLMSNDILQMLLGQPSATVALNAGLKTTQMIVKTYSTSMEVRNITTGPVILWEYRCTARKDLSVSGATAVSTMITDAGGWADAEARTGGSIPLTSPVVGTTLGATLFMNPRFVSAIKIRKVKKFTLAASRSKKFTYTTRKPRLIKAEDFNYGLVPDPDGSVGPSRQVSRGQSFSVFVTHGTFASNTGGGGTALIGIGNSSLGITASVKVHYAVIAVNAMTSGATTAVAGFTQGVDRYPAPLMITHPDSAISTGPVPAAAGTRTYGATDAFAVQDSIMAGP